ncbi:MAG: hypothetical protein JWP29_3524 [Rhodoferax sp.]|nr:hypothetical protein [Rhodoferax sp.]
MVSNRPVLSAFLYMRLLFIRTPWWGEIVGAITAFAWGLVAWISPGDLARWPSMSLLLQIGDDQFWCGICMSLGLLQFTVALFDRRWCRWGMALCMSWLWAIIALGIFSAVGLTPVIVPTCGWALMNVVSILRLLRYQ